jgi:hypothetical protein
MTPRAAPTTSAASCARRSSSRRVSDMRPATSPGHSCVPSRTPRSPTRCVCSATFQPVAPAATGRIGVAATIFGEDYRALQRVMAGDGTPKLTIPSPSMVHYGAVRADGQAGRRQQARCRRTGKAAGQRDFRSRYPSRVIRQHAKNLNRPLQRLISRQSGTELGRLTLHRPQIVDARQQPAAGDDRSERGHSVTERGDRDMQLGVRQVGRRA